MHESTDPLIGKELGSCVLDRMVGSGGMGMVYLAHQTRPIRNVAVKVLRSGAGVYTEAHKEFLERFRREANVIARLDHVNILPIYGYDEQDGLAYLVMPYLTGGSLRTLLAERGKLSPQEALTYIEQAGAALQYAHEHQIVHRDIKPANMLFHADGRLVLVDFGIARITRDSGVGELSDASLTAIGQFLGSAEYMAPEMAQGHKVDHRADLYELGIVLFQMLAGRVPFQGSTVLSIAAMHINGTPHSLTHLEPTVPRSLDLVVQKVLAKNPDDRYNSAREFVEAVRLAINSSSSFSQNINNFPVNPAAPFLPPEYNSNPSSQAPQGVYHALGDSNLSFTVHENPSTLSTPSNQGYQDVSEPTYVIPESISYPSEMYISQGHSPQGYNAPGNGGPAYFNQMQFAPASPQAYGQPRKARRRPMLIVAFGIALVLCILGILLVPNVLANFNHAVRPTPKAQIIATTVPVATATPMPTPTPTATSTPTEEAQAVVQLYFSDLNSKDYQGAYNQLSTTFHAVQSYDSFVTGYANTNHDDVTYNSIDALTDGTYRCNVNLTVSETDANGVETTSMYTGYYIVGVDNGALKIFPNSSMQKE